MAIGNHTFWIIVSIPDKAALTALNDRRLALRFDSEAAASAYLTRRGLDRNFYIVVEVPA